MGVCIYECYIDQKRYTNFHEDHIANVDSLTIISVNGVCVYMRARFRSKSMWLIFISNAYIPIRIICTTFRKVRVYMYGNYI